MEFDIENVSLSDLVIIKSDIEKGLSLKEGWVDAVRGRDYDEYMRRHYLYHTDENHAKLERVNAHIKEVISAVTK